MGGGGDPQTQSKTTTTNLSPEQQSLLGLAMPALQKYAANPTTVPTSGLIAPFNANQTAGQQQVLGATGSQGDIVGSAGDASKFLTSGAALSPSSNPAEAMQIEAATRPIQQNLQENTLPQLRNAATGVGQTGSSREGIAEGIASRGASQAEGATAANIANTNYNTGLSAMVHALGLAPGTAGAQTIPGVTTSDVGDVQQQNQQQNIDAQLQAQLYNSQQPLATGEALAGIASGIPGGSTTSTGTTTGGDPSTMQKVLGYGGLGASLLGAGGTAGLGAALGTGATAAGSSIASLLPLLAISDRRLKREIQRIGTIANGLPLYRFKFLWSKESQVGLMADEVEQLHPEAVFDFAGVKAVDYSRAVM